MNGQVDCEYQRNQKGGHEVIWACVTGPLLFMTLLSAWSMSRQVN